MKKIACTVLPALLLAFSLPASAASCPKDMKMIDEALQSGTSLSSSDMAMVKELRASGEAKHKSGDHSGSVADLHKAKGMLGI